MGLSDSIVTSTAVSPEVKRTTVPSAELLAEAMPGGKVAEIADVEEAGPAGVVHPAAANTIAADPVMRSFRRIVFLLLGCSSQVRPAVNGTIA